MAAHEPEVTAGTLTRRGFLVASAAATVAVAGGGTAAMAEPGPEEFAGRWWWGTASSAVQCEGASPADDWYRWERAGHAPESGDGNGFRRRYREDFALLRSLGTTDHRLSINWARVEPREGHQDLEAIEYYRSVLAAGRAEGLRIWVCLLHSAIPVWFADRGGFAAEDALKTWMRWVELAEKLFGDLVGGWMPVNLATSYAQKAYGTGTFPPGHRDPAELVSVLKTLHHCNFEAALRLRKAGALTCSNEAVLPLEALDRSPGAAAAVARLDELVWGSWLSLTKDPRYAEAWDYIGFSYYFGALVTEKGELLPRPDGAKPGPLGYVPWADGLALVLDRMAAELPGRKFVLAELGYGGDGGLDDQDRENYLRSALKHVAAAQDSGMRVEGVTLWAGIDNYEWLSGFGVPFGLVTADRVPRRSAGVVSRP